MTNIFPGTVADRTAYPLCNAHNIDIIARRTELFANSFISSAISLWNELLNDIRRLMSLSLFKWNILRLFQVSSVPKHFPVAERKLSVIHARLRNDCSDLNYDLYLNHMTNNIVCFCGNYIEDAEHYLYKCKLYKDQRLKLVHNLHDYQPLNPLNTSLILSGS